MPYINNNIATLEQKTITKQFKNLLKKFHTENMNREQPLRGVTHKYELWAVSNPEADAPCVSVNLSAAQPHMTRADIDEFVEWVNTNTDFEHPIKVKGSTIKVLFRGDLGVDYGQGESEATTRVNLEDLVGELPAPPPTFKRPNPFDLLK